MPYVLDTNIISELMKDNPNPKVIHWLDQQIISELFISSITVAEILFGIKRLEQGKRKSRLVQQAALILETHFGDRTYTFDKKSAVFYADIRQQRTKQGLPISHADCQIAAITCQYACILVTRNTKDFYGIDGLTLLNPFD
ncbi:MAG TPA: type II toxin-antitoxin system VapC family toxin [Agitococcus sp.]|jgi:predicted nucleic acid-binding protein|nr:type II toxin-antitoxin system VapC family toxin [Agitococcus sp.]HMY01437.1 type II toxin-antitoxin system VapC family toxin [Agitococcus sp.]HNA21744.1 type II toxin-antitoxin system VapC family toxin [Agitococcus sp.]HNC03977.1 type II toxin-antitoxin system VapC family toxin [Agitococcus sp.]HNE91897.1 type II toxin-antitoxin system VapC family toxin [Agitococcus sp.]